MAATRAGPHALAQGLQVGKPKPFRAFARLAG